MHRRLTIRTNPPGALVKLDGREIGFSPVSTDMTYYGTREITLVKDGYQTVTLRQEIGAPWYQVFPLDFVSDNFAFQQVKDRREFTYNLQPAADIESTQGLKERANALRSEAFHGQSGGF